MKENQINVKQLCAIFLAFTPITKIITAPAVFAGYCNEKLWQPILILALFDLVLFALLTRIVKKHEGKTFFEILSESFTPTFAKIIFFIYALFFLAKSIMPIIEQKEFIENAFYETLPKAPVFYPVFAVLFYLCIKGFKTFGRSAQICAVATISGLALILFLSFLSGDFKTLLPLFAFSNKSSAICALNGLSWFNDAIYLFFFIGYCKLNSKGVKSTLIAYGVSTAIILLFFLTFYSIFSFVSQTQELAINSMSIFGVTLVNVGRFDYIALFLLAMSGTVAIAFPLIIATNCLALSFNAKNKVIPAIIVCLVIFIVVLLFSNKYEEVLKTIVTYCTPIYILCGYILPFLGLGGKKNEIQKS